MGKRSGGQQAGVSFGCWDQSIALTRFWPLRQPTMPGMANQTPGHSSAGDPVPVGGSVMNVVAVAVDRWSCELIAMAARVKLWKWTCTASLSTTTS
jgi:hypothetical protein